MGKQYILGIDEAGRGPWAGPLVVAGWCLEVAKASEIYTTLVGLTDSKALRESDRETLFEKIRLMPHHIIEQSAEVIDTLGIREANRKGMEEIIGYFVSEIDVEDSLMVWIDGCDNYEFSSSEPYSYTFAQKSNQKRIKASSEKKERIHVQYKIAGDLSELIISGASILAKVTRDQKMCDFSVIYPNYGFKKHKGYGTKLHRDQMINYGITPIHRKSYAPVKRLISRTSSV